MTNSALAFQNPSPGTHLLRFRGDVQTFTLSLQNPQEGGAWLRTNIGHAGIARDEIIREVDFEETPLGRDWFDIPMKRIEDRRFQVTLPLGEVGHFEAKCFFLSKSEEAPIWPEGSNAVINVEPADTCCLNTIYNAFVRQFGPNKAGGGPPGFREEKSIRDLDRKGYAVIPPSGKFRDLIQKLDFIVGELGCRIIQLLPIHPTPTTYGRMGRFGSPFASLSFKTVDPALAEFDPKATPLEQFIELVDAVHARNAKVIIDIAINHTGWAARLHDTHSQWLVRDTDGQIEVPGAWGVLWEDLTKLDYTQKEIWQFMAGIFLTWCRRGVDGFRCDAGYMIPLSAWKYMVSSVREQYPDTLFLLEGLGGKLSVTRELLNRGNFNWAYSELFQNYDRSQIEYYLPGAIGISETDGILVHFSETHDNNRLAARSRNYAGMRTALCALCSHQGAFGFANGVEWYATEKIDVHGAPSLNWDNPVNQVKQIRRLTTLLRVHPAFFDQTELRLIRNGEGNGIVLLRHHLPTGKRLLVVANLDDGRGTTATWDIGQSGIDGSDFVDLLTDEKLNIALKDRTASCVLDPGQVRCLSPDPDDIPLIGNAAVNTDTVPDRIERQQKRAKVFDILKVFRGIDNLEGFDLDLATLQLEKNPVALCRSLNPFSGEPRVITWHWPQDVKREVMVPPGYFLLISADVRFCASIQNKDRTVAQEESLHRADGSFFALFSPLPTPKSFQEFALKLSVYENKGGVHAEAPLLYLPQAQKASIHGTYRRSELLHQPLLLLGTNGRGGMLRAPVSWGELNSRYDALLAANLNPELPEDRWILFARCRVWVVFQGYSQEIGKTCLDLFRSENDSRGFWQFQAPTGQGEHILLNIGLEMLSAENAVRIIFSRHPSEGKAARLSDEKKIRVILRPDIENRSFHETTKAYTGPERHFPASVERHSKGFTFAPDPNRRLIINVSDGMFVWEPEWHYMVHRPAEAERGLDPNSDLFSPGYFYADIAGGQLLELTAQASNSPDETILPPAEKLNLSDRPETDTRNLENALSRALDHFIVKRGKLKTIIAGYPWFLDWGRDALIAVRGLIADGKTQDARAVLKQFAQFEEHGTLPNMIQGNDAGNRDTSDAPLWFFVAAKDIVFYEGNESFMDEAYGKRSVREILISMGQSLLNGTPNGIRMDPESGLLFSPNHFTWMDTNYPAGTPRQGYPIEIQALWYAALSFLSRIDPENDWKDKAHQVQTSVLDLFFLETLGYLSDCRHAHTGQTAATAEPDDALRPNQLFAVTMGVVTEPSMCKKIVTACQELLIPGAIRSLADRPVRRPLPIRHHGKLLNHPDHPYQGRYIGDEDTCRKPAYHNGTAWTWVFPSFCEAWVKTFGTEAKETALAWLASCARLLHPGCVGHIPEILDGDYPHRQRGCDAQAWGVSEALRVWKQLNR